MPFVDNPTLPAQNQQVRLQPPGLRGLSPWAYLALASVILCTLGVLCYVGYSVHHAMNINNPTTLTQYKSKSAEKRTKNKTWRAGVFNFRQHQDLETRRLVDRRKCPSESSLVPSDKPRMPVLTIPAAAVSSPPKTRALPQYDMHNIRFASPSNLAIYNNPKLKPVAGSAIPLSYDSRENLFPNPFTPATTTLGHESRTKDGRQNASLLSRALRGKSKSKASKENFKVLSGDLEGTGGVRLSKGLC